MSLTIVLVLLLASMLGFFIGRSIILFFVKSVLVIAGFLATFTLLVWSKYLLINHDLIDDIPHAVIFYMDNATFETMSLISMFILGLAVSVYTYNTVSVTNV